jgi:hypothetical protein
LFNLGNKVWILSTQPISKSSFQHFQSNLDLLFSERLTGKERLMHGITIPTL